MKQLECYDVRIRQLGDFAIIHAQTRYTKGDGRPGKGRYTDIWACRDGRWLCVAAHVTQWYGLPPLLYGIAMCQIGNWSCPIHEQGGVRHEGYNEWN